MTRCSHVTVERDISQKHLPPLEDDCKGFLHIVVCIQYFSKLYVGNYYCIFIGCSMNSNIYKKDDFKVTLTSVIFV